MNRLQKAKNTATRVIALADGSRSSVEIARLLGLNPRHVRKILLKYDLPRLPPHSPIGERNGAYVGGRRITLGGYVKVSAPKDHPHATLLRGKNIPHIFEHRLVMEKHLGRYLLPSEIVDHIDGLTLHNSPENLRLFACNADHLHETLTGKVPRWSEAGFQNMKLRHVQDAVLTRVDTHRQHKEAGVLRLRQILLLASQLGVDSPYLLGTHHWTKKAGIDTSSRSTIELALDDLCQKWGLPRTPL